MSGWAWQGTPWLGLAGYSSGWAWLAGTPPWVHHPWVHHSTRPCTTYTPRYAPSQAHFLSSRGGRGAQLRTCTRVNLQFLDTHRHARVSTSPLPKIQETATVLSRQGGRPWLSDPFAEPPLTPFCGMLTKTRFIGVWPLKPPKPWQKRCPRNVPLQKNAKFVKTEILSLTRNANGCDPEVLTRLTLPADSTLLADMRLYSP